MRLIYTLDPESYAWDPLDTDYLARLSVRKYVSLSRERRLGIPAPSIGPDARDGAKDDSSSGQGQAQVISGLRSPATNGEDETAVSISSSLFDRDMPGIITPEQLMAEVPIEDVRYRYGGATVSAGVSFCSHTAMFLVHLSLMCIVYD